MTTIVRQAVAEDAHAVARLSRADGVGERLGSILADTSRAVFIAEVDGSPAGIAEVQFYGVSLRRDFGSARLHDIYVEEEYRRRGIARELFEAVRAWVCGVPACHYLEWQSSEGGLAFYEAIGLRGNAENDTNEYPFFEIAVRG